MDIIEVLFKNRLIGNIERYTLHDRSGSHVNIKFTVKNLKRKRSVAE
jgi:hypothetical protein